MIINTTDDDGEVICVARLLVEDAEPRKLVTLHLDDERAERAFTGLNVLIGCLTAVLKAEYEEKTGRVIREVNETATSNRPDVPTCEGACE